MRCRMSLQRRLVEHEGAAEVALQRLAEEDQVLLPERQVEAERLDRALALDLVGIGADQDLHRVADGVDADEDDDRHRQHDAGGLDQPPEEVDGHRAACPGRGRAHVLRPRQLVARARRAARPRRIAQMLVWMCSGMIATSSTAQARRVLQHASRASRRPARATAASIMRSNSGLE